MGIMHNHRKSMENKCFENVKLMRKADKGYESVTKILQKFIEHRHGVKFNDYWDFHKWSIDHIDKFWGDVWDFSGVISSKKYDEVIDPNAPVSEAMEWFKGAKLNYAENVLKYKDDGIALITLGEEKGVNRISYAQTHDEVKLYAAAFRNCGLKKGDVVVCYMSNREEPVFAMLATTSIGAIWSGALPLIGSKAALDRFRLTNPKFLITIDRFRNDGKEIEMLPKVKAIAEGISSLEKVIIVPSKGVLKLPDIKDIKNSCFIHEFLELGKEKDGSIPPIHFEQVSVSHPVFISYTSGTTGLPKAPVHGFGVIFATTRDFFIHYDSSRSSIWLSMSPVGWASWNMFSSLHFHGLTVVLFEGMPYYLSPTYFWYMVEDLKITHLFLSSSVVDELQKRGYVPKERHNLATLKGLNAGGSIVKPYCYDFVYEKIKRDILFSSSYGFTEIMGTCLVRESVVDIYRGEIPAIALGCAVETVDEKGNRVVGEIGELILSKPMPGMCNSLWGDLDGSLYREKYLSKHPGKFTSGDFALMNPVTKGWVIYGRSDDTLKQRGCRFGSAEIYNVVELFPQIRDSICVSKYNKDMDESAVLFLKIREGHKLNNDLVKEIRTAIARELTIRHVPDFIMETRDIPYNINGKKLEIIVKNIINNRPYNSDSIINPESLNCFFNVPELKDM